MKRTARTLTLIVAGGSFSQVVGTRPDRRRRGGVIPDGEAGAQLALLVRGGCSLYSDAYLLTAVDRAILAELPKLPKR